jgi:bla regulator protein BlaR1
VYIQIGNHLWQSTLFAVIIVILCRLLRKDGANVRYWLWWIASIKFLVPFSVLSALGTWLGVRTAVELAPETWATTVTVVASPFKAGGVPWSPGLLLLGLQATGSISLLLVWAVRGVRLQRLLRRADLDPEPLVDGRRRVRVYRTRARIEPGVIGVLRTVLLLPWGLEQQLNERQLEAVVAHELCHVRRRDNLTAAVHMLVEAAFWFHPLVWWIGARLIDERERACDEMVVALGHDRETYAAGILDVCEHYLASPLPCASGISGSDLKVRITEIMRYQGMNRLRLAKKLLLGASGVASLAIPLLTGLAIEHTAVAQETGQSSPSSAAAPVADSANAAKFANSEYAPIDKIAPVYPVRAAARGLEGYVILKFTVAADGTTEDIEVVESSSSLFDQTAIESAQHYRYKPRIVNGTPTAVPGVMTKIIFELEPNDESAAPPSPPQQ